MSTHGFYLSVLNAFEGDEVVIPDESFTGVILKHFKMNRDDFERAFHQAAGAFAKLWNLKSNPDLSYDFKSGKISDGTMSFTIVSEGKLDRVGYKSIKGWISTPELNAALQSFKKETGRLLPHRDLFGMIVGGVLKGKDLISACLSSTAVNKHCEANDQQLFKQRLEEEFDIDFDDDGYDYPNARSLYVQMHTLYAKRYQNKYGIKIVPFAGDRQLAKQLVIEGSEETILVPQSGDRIGADWEPVKEFFVISRFNGETDDDDISDIAFTVEWEDDERTIPETIRNLMGGDEVTGHLFDVFEETLSRILKVRRNEYLRHTPNWTQSTGKDLGDRQLITMLSRYQV